MCGNILRYIAHTILLICENMFAMLILHALILLHSGNNMNAILIVTEELDTSCNHCLQCILVPNNTIMLLS